MHRDRLAVVWAWIASPFANVVGLFSNERIFIFRGRGEGACAGMVKMRTLVLMGDDDVGRRDEERRKK